MASGTEQDKEDLGSKLTAANKRITELESELKASNTDERLLTLLDSLPGARRLRTMIDNLPGVAYRCKGDNRWDMEFISTEIEGFSGHPQSDFLHNNIRSFSSIVHLDDLQLIEDSVHDAISQHQPYAIDYRINHINGTILWVYERGQGVFNDKGEVEYLDGIILDNTDKHDAYEALQRSESRFQNILDASPVPYALNDEKGNIVYLNSSFVNMFGYELTDIPTLDEWWPKAYPDENYRKQVAQVWAENLEKSKINNSPFEPLEIDITCKDQTSRTVLASAAPLTGKYENIHLVILYDITERKLAKGKLKETVNLLENIVNSTPDLIFVKDSNLKTIFCNESYARGVGKSRESMYGNTDIENGWDEELINGNPEKGIRGFKHDDMDALSGLDVHNPYDPANIDGQIHIFDTHKMPLKDDYGVTIGVLGVARDVTEAKRTEQQLRQSQKMDAIGKLTGGIAHDFNNMLGVILGYTELAQNLVGDNPTLLKYINQIQTAGDRAKSLTSKLLTFSRKQHSHSKSCLINEVLKRDQAMLEKTLTAKIQFNLSMQEDLWHTFIDEEMLADAILNICINSMHAMPKGGELDISTENIHLDESSVLSLNIPPGDYVKLVIKDSGEGIDRSVIEHVFEPFFTTKGDSGTGLGMSQVYGFVMQAKGDIFIQSVLGKGTSVVMYLPRYDNEEKTDIFDSTSNETFSTEGKETILVVDDELSLREFTEEILTANGFKVVTAENAYTALDRLEEGNIDLLLSDVIMPGMDGYQLAADVRDKYPDVKIQMVSGYNDNHYTNEADEQLKRQQINKPFNINFLMKRIRSLLDE